MIITRKTLKKIGKNLKIILSKLNEASDAKEKVILD